MQYIIIPILAAILASFFLTGPVWAIDGRLMRYPDIHGDRVVFTYEDDLWSASINGGLAARLTSHPGMENRASFSPDGEWIAFTGST
jgi:tricorn protease